MGKRTAVNLALVACLSTGASLALAQGNVAVEAAAANMVAYELQEGSTLTFTYWPDDQTDPVTITTALQGKFVRIWRPGSHRYELAGLSFQGQNSPTPVSVTGRGWYQPRAGCTQPERMMLFVEITGFPEPDDRLITMDSGPIWIPQGDFPTIILDVYEISTSVVRHYKMHLIATPRRLVDFSTVEGFESADTSGTQNRWISDGDLLRDNGLIVRTNQQLMRHFGVMPPIPPVGLDGVARCPACPTAVSCSAGLPNTADRRCVLFTTETTVWSETLQTWLGHGDLLCECGFVLRTNWQLIQAFRPIAGTPDVGLDGVHPISNTEIWFTTDQGFWAFHPSGTHHWISPDDVLSDQGYVVRTMAQLLERFHPISVAVSPGLDDFAVLTNGEIYFSVETEFDDAVYGRISPGDLLSDAGYVVERNRELISPFHPLTTRDVGLDAVHLDPDAHAITVAEQTATAVE